MRGSGYKCEGVKDVEAGGPRQHGAAHCGNHGHAWSYGRVRGVDDGEWDEGKGVGNEMEMGSMEWKGPM